LDGDGKLSRKEVIEVLKATLPVDNAELDAIKNDSNSQVWQKWDSDGSGFVEQAELLRPGGLLEYVRGAFAAEEQSDKAIPDLKGDKNGWFRHWDEDGSQSLEQNELVRALVHTWQIEQEFDKLETVKESIAAVWCIFDHDGSGSIELEEFVAEGGMADTIIASIDFLAQPAAARATVVAAPPPAVAAPPPLAAPPLPEGWAVALDPASGRHYYYHHDGRTSWELP